MGANLEDWRRQKKCFGHSRLLVLQKNAEDRLTNEKKYERKRERIMKYLVERKKLEMVVATERKESSINWSHTSTWWILLKRIIEGMVGGIGHKGKPWLKYINPRFNRYGLWLILWIKERMRMIEEGGELLPTSLQAVDWWQGGERREI